MDSRMRELNMYVQFLVSENVSDFSEAFDIMYDVIFNQEDPTYISESEVDSDSDSDYEYISDTESESEPPYEIYSDDEDEIDLNFGDD